MRDTFVRTLCALAEEDERITLITGDLGFGVLDTFRSKFPSRYINAGVAEQNMALLATGMALEGRVVFTYSIANFPTLRCLEMLRNDAAYHDAAVKVVAIGGGFSYGSLGISHHATEDLAIMRALPGIDVLSPGGLLETEALTREIAARTGTAYLRLDKDPGAEAEEPCVFGVPRRLAAGEDVVMLVTGGILSEAIKARALLLEQGTAASVYSVHTVKPMVAEAIVDIVRSHKVIVSIEEHTVSGGLGSAILEILADANVWPEQLVRIGLKQCFSSLVGSQQHLRRAYALDAESIAARIAQVLEVART